MHNLFFMILFLWMLTNWNDAARYGVAVLWWYSYWPTLRCCICMLLMSNVSFRCRRLWCFIPCFSLLVCLCIICIVEAPYVYECVCANNLCIGIFAMGFLLLFFLSGEIRANVIWMGRAMRNRLEIYILNWSIYMKRKKIEIVQNK